MTMMMMMMLSRFPGQRAPLPLLLSLSLSTHATVDGVLMMQGDGDGGGDADVGGGGWRRAGLTHEECLRKQRVLALAGLASGREELSYAQVAQELGVEEGEVEAWVIEAVGAGVVDARLDQTRRVVLVNHVTLRTFTAEHWQQMSSRLALWKDNLVSLLEVVQQNKKLAA